MREQLGDDFVDMHFAEDQEIEQLTAVESAADQVFNEAGIQNLPPAASSSELKTAKALIVAGNPPIGFVRIEEIDANAHLEQLSVIPEESGKGTGGRLLEQACRWATEHGYSTMTLSTFRDIEWNAPFYAKHGFEILTELTPGLENLRQHEIEIGLDKIGPRVVMARVLAG